MQLIILHLSHSVIAVIHEGGKGSQRGYYYMNNKNNPICFFYAGDCLDYAEKSARSQKASPWRSVPERGEFPNFKLITEPMGAS